MRDFCFDGYNFPEQGNQDRGLITNVMAESVGRVYHASLADTLDRISLVNTKKLTNKRP